MSAAMQTSYETTIKSHYAAVKARLGRGPIALKPKLVPRPMSPFHPRLLAEKLEERLADPVHVEPVAEECTLAPEYADPALPMETPFLPGEEPSKPPTSAEIIREVCDKHRVRPVEVVSEIRSRPIVAARHEAMYRIREERHLSWSQIGRLFGRDHTSVLAGWRQHQARMAAQEAVGA